jgi:hypothetical protein
VQQLTPYTAVLVWADQDPLDAAALGDNLATYFENGGRVVVALFPTALASELGGKFVDLWTGDGARIIVNALNHQ